MVEVEEAFEILGVEEEDATGLADELETVGVEAEDLETRLLDEFLRLGKDFLLRFDFLGASSSLELELDLLLSSSSDDSILFDWDDFFAFLTGGGLMSSEVTVRLDLTGDLVSSSSSSSSSSWVRGDESGSGSFLFDGGCTFGLGLVLISTKSSESSESGRARSFPFLEGTDGRGDG